MEGGVTSSKLTTGLSLSPEFETKEEPLDNASLIQSSHLCLHDVDDQSFKQRTECKIESNGIDVEEFLRNRQTLEELLDTSYLLTNSTFSCSICSFTTDKQPILRDHEKEHLSSSKPIVQCIYCSQKYTEEMLSLHIQEIHPGQKFQIASKLHQQAHNRDDPIVQRSKRNTISYDCSQCSYTSSKKYNLLKHKRNHDRGAPIIQCSRCDYKSTLLCVRNHEKICKKVLGKSQFACTKCNFSTNLRIKLKKHLSAHSSRDSTKEMLQETFRCSKCPFVANTLMSLREHRKKYPSHRVKEHGKAFSCAQCSWCDYKSTPKAVQSHLKHCKHSKPIGPLSSSSELNKTQFQCTKCSFSTNLRVKLRKHLRIHDINKLETAKEIDTPILKQHSIEQHAATFKCSQCSFSTTDRLSFQRHKHDRNNPIVQCSWCDYKSTYRAVCDHLKVCNYSKTGKYECFLCPFVTDQRDDLRKHRVSHEQKVKCPYCPLAINNLGNYKQHVRSHERGYTKECSKCGLKSTPSHIMKHQLKCKSLKGNDSRNEESPSIPDESRFQCSKSTNLPVKLLRNHHQEGPKKVPSLALKKTLFQCSHCSFTTILRIKLKRHLKSHDTRQRKCSYCSVTLNNPGNYRVHLKSHRKNGSKTCTWCGFKSTPSLVARHKMKCRIKQKEGASIAPRSFKDNCTFKCSECSFVTNLRIKLKKHLESHDRSEKPPIEAKRELFIRLERENLELGKIAPSERVFSCDICSYTSLIQASWKKHLSCHRQFNTPIYQCENCGFKTTKNYIKSHCCRCSSAVRPKKVLLNCFQCSFTTYFPRDLETHREEKHKQKKAVKQLKCEYCSFTSFWQYLMERHIRSHTELDLPIAQCRTCDFRSTPAALSAHSNVCLQLGSVNKSPK